MTDQQGGVSLGGYHSDYVDIGDIYSEDAAHWALYQLTTSLDMAFSNLTYDEQAQLNAMPDGINLGDIAVRLTEHRSAGGYAIELAEKITEIVRRRLAGDSGGAAGGGGGGGHRATARRGDRNNTWIAWDSEGFDIEGRRFERPPREKWAPGDTPEGEVKIEKKKQHGGFDVWEIPGYRAIDFNGPPRIMIRIEMNEFDQQRGEFKRELHVANAFTSKELPTGIMRAIMATMLLESEDLGNFEMISGNVANKKTLEVVQAYLAENGPDAEIPVSVLANTTLGKMRADYANRLGYEVTGHKWNNDLGKLYTYVRKRSG